MPKVKNKCLINGCNKPSQARGYCHNHYNCRWKLGLITKLDPQTDREYLESRVEMIPEAGCWLWIGSTYLHGYGFASRNAKAIPAHRLAYKTYVGAIPDGMCVCHKCDVPRCCNPEHLFLGTHKDNMLDARKKCRNNNKTFNGPKNHLASLTWDQVEEIRSSSESNRTLADKFKVAILVVQRVRKGNTYKTDGVSSLKEMRRDRKVTDHIKGNDDHAP